MSICYRGASGFWSWLPLTWMTARRSVIKWRMGDYLLVDTGSWGDAEASREIPWLQCIYATVDEAELASRCGGD